MIETEFRFDAYLAHDGGAIEGWSFAAMSSTGRTDADPMPWSYGSIVIPWIQRAESMLDMGTGGGELLSNLRPLPAETHATEAWAPNITVARARLEPLGVRVHALEHESDPLPFAEATFDLVINRHGSYDPAEVFRVLKPGGRFITQQVGGRNNRDLNDLFETAPGIDDPSWNLERASREVIGANFQIADRREAFPAARFYDIGALVFYLRAIPWQIAGFSVEAFRGKLFELHLLIESQGWLETSEHRFLIEAEKPRSAGVS
ncbi:class I SAM-dependent methyltransferase [soil metagenome]